MRQILREARKANGHGSMYRCLGRWCDYHPWHARWQIRADGELFAATCRMHVGRAVIDVTNLRPDAVLTFHRAENISQAETLRIDHRRSRPAPG